MKESHYKKYLLGVLLTVLAFNYVDRFALGLMLQDIKVDLDLSDTQLGVLTGIAFALFYSIMGIPIARWADCGNRITIISLTTALWSAAVALCGLATSFVHLLLIRVGVAIGEAGCIPPAHSLIADHFSRADRPRAVAIYMLGASLSVLIGYFLAGWLNQFYGWRTTFVLLGLPGLALAAVVWLTLKEPRLRTASEASARNEAAPADSPPLRVVFSTLWANTTFRHLLLCFSVTSFFGYGIGQWQPAFFIRSFGLETGELGTWFALIFGAAGMLGIYMGGELSSRYAARNERLQLRTMAVMYSLSGFVSASVYLSPNHYLAFGLLAFNGICEATITAPLFATIQSLIPSRMRAVSIAILYLFANLIGMGFGPLAAGALSDALRPIVGEESLRYALLALCPGYLWGAWHLLMASRSVTKDLERAQQDEPVEPGGVAPIRSKEPLAVRHHDVYGG